MQDLAREFGICRSLSHAPSVWNWRKLCGHLDRWATCWHEPFVQEQVLPYLRDRLDHWPEDVPRYAQHLWLHKTFMGQDVPQLEFATALQFVSQEVTPSRLARLFDSPFLSRVTDIDVRALPIDDELFFAIVNAQSLERLERVTVKASNYVRRVSPWLRRDLESRGVVLIDG